MTRQERSTKAGKKGIRIVANLLRLIHKGIVSQKLMNHVIFLFAMICEIKLQRRYKLTNKHICI